MNNFKNIDRLFQEKLKDYEVNPPKRIWSGIENNLTELPQKKVVPFWVKFISVAAVLLLFVSLGAIYLLPNNQISENLFKVPSKKATVANNHDTLKPFEKVNLVTDSKVIKAQNKIAPQLNSSINSDNRLSTISPEQKLTQNSKKVNFKSTGFLTSNQTKKEITKPLTTANKIKKETDNKFTVATIFAPIYMNAIGGNSGLNGDFKNNPSSSNSSYSYGVKVAYQLNRKFSIQSGVNLINLGITTNNIYITPGVSAVGLSNISSSPNLGKTGKSSKADVASSGNLNQVFGYVEIPVEVKYNVTNGKFGVNLVGGFSTLLLNKNELFVETSDFTQSLGSSNNLRSVNFSGNLGLDIDYSIRKNLYLNVSPMFKLQTNTFYKNSGSLLPYYLGVYTGINYKF
ncbi:MAG: outer membrane beta-barrel protein [Lutibacter sp.]